MIERTAATLIDEIFEAIFGVELSKHGFKYANHRKWVRSHKDEIRELFLIQALKGANYSPVWGFSLDFVPHCSGKKILWHRTPKSARLDLRYDLTASR